MLTIKQRQLNLKTYYNYYKGSIDGIEGEVTKRAYRDFQRDFKLDLDGVYGVNTENALISACQTIQSKLNRKGYHLTLDGICGTNTINAIKDFQKKNGLTPDGIAGSNTFAKLGSYKCKHFADSEFACECGCGLNLCKDGIKMIADNIREHFNTPVIITSGTRCTAQNRRDGGIPNSWHLYGNAIDIVASGVSGQTLLNYCQSIVNSGRANYTYLIVGNAVHIDDGNKE